MSFPAECPATLARGKPDSNEFELALDENAFSLQFLEPVRDLMRVSKLDAATGLWDADHVFFRSSTYKDPLVTLQGKGPSRATITVAQGAEVYFMFVKSGKRPQRVLCRKGRQSVVYVKIFFSRERMDAGQAYEVTQDVVLLCVPHDRAREKPYLLIVNTPDEPSDKRPPSVNDWVESNLDPTLLFLASNSLRQA